MTINDVATLFLLLLVIGFQVMLFLKITELTIMKRLIEKYIARKGNKE
jgi:hypothetical protein